MESIEVVVIDSGWTIAQTIGTCVGALGAIIALLYFAKQTKSMAESFRFDYQWRRHNKSSDLALFYAHSILPRISYCSIIISQADIYSRLKSMDPKRMIRFTRAELEELFGDDDAREQIEKSLEKLDLQVFLRARSVVPIDFRDEEAELFSRGNEHDTIGQNLLHSAAEGEFWCIAEGLLNDLEYFSMCLNSRIADEKVLYPSLHQTFFSTISILYPLIALQNTNMRDKYYTHIIRLFTEWKQRFLEHESKEHQVEDQMNQPYHQVL